MFGGAAAVAVGTQFFYSAAVPGDGRELRVASLTPPAAPDGLAASGGSTAGSARAASSGVQLNWVDHSNNESGFVIERSNAADFSTIDRRFFVPANTTSFTDASAFDGYYYRVRSVNAGGDSVFSSPGSAKFAAVSGVVFNDANHNGTRDMGEAGLASVTVYLDANNNGMLDPGEKSILTDASGRYTFGGLAAGTYAIREVPPEGFRRTTAVPTVSAAVGRTAAGPVFGNVRASDVPLDFTYLLALAQHYGRTGTFATGDLNGDDKIDFADLLILAQNYVTRRPATARHVQPIPAHASPGIA